MTYGHGGPTDPFGRDPFSGDPFSADASFDAKSFGGASASPPAASPPDVNTLATLSVVFAFVFAPAGAVLGHLGLAQLGRTGQRGRDRALIGLTLSYLFITVAVVSLVVWIAIGTPTQPPNIAAPHPAVPSATTTSPPTAAAPTLTAIAPPGPLLNVDEMKAILGNPLDKDAPASVPVPDLAAYPPFDAVDTGAQTQGRVSDSDCAATVFAWIPSRASPSRTPR
jgi:eukaryotic-like serine/threonine-protein kinase